MKSILQKTHQKILIKCAGSSSGSFSLVFIIPAFLVEEDLRRLSMKEMKQSEYVEDRAILALNPHEKQNFMTQHNIIEEKDDLDHYKLIYMRMSLPVVWQSGAPFDDK